MADASAHILFLAALATLVACKKDQVEDPDLLPPAESASGPAPEEPEVAPEEASAVRVDDRIVQMCNVPAASFAFNPSKVRTPARSSLGALATCFLDGPASGESVRIVGHADPQGDDDYDLAVGRRRANAVAEYLGREGLGSARVATTARGELDMQSLDELGWVDDRRVDILLVGP